MKHIITLLTLLFVIISGSNACAETLKVGISTGYAPVAFKIKGKVVGIEVDLAKAIGDITGMSIKVIEYPWEELEQALNRGDIDVVMSGVSITDARKKRVDFSQPYMTVGQMVLIKADNIMSLSSKMSMYTAGRRFGAEKNTTGEQYVKAEFSGSPIFSYDTVEQGIKALKAGKIDYFVHDAPTIWQYTVLLQTQDKALFGLYEYMTKEPLAWAVKKGNTALLDKLNQSLATMQQKGQVNQIVNRWIPVKVEVGN